MALLHVVYYPDDPLTQKATAIDKFDADLTRLAEDMLETMHEYKGVGLAGPQIGKSQRIFVLQEPEGPEMVFVNPRIVGMEGREEGEEGCLSMPEIYAMVPRATEVQIEFQDVDGKTYELESGDFLARIIQHENDHLDGILFPERLDIFTRQEKLSEWEVVRRRMDSETEED
jgi:peptide deformylase